MFRGCQVACIGFTFTKDSPLNQIGKLGENLKTELLEEGAPTIAATVDMPCPKCPGLEVSPLCSLSLVVLTGIGMTECGLRAQLWKRLAWCVKVLWRVCG